MTLSQELTWRGFVNQTTLQDPKVLDDASLSFYIGMDPSASSLTVGNLAAAMMVKHFINAGHTAVLLVGGATGLIGDPKEDAERQLKTEEEISKNKQALASQYRQIFEGQHFELVDNYDWFKDIKYLDFLRDIGKHFSMTQLLDREFVQARIGEGGSGISYAEFSYSLIQGYDFLHLFREKGVTLQVCGSDQWGNSLSGVQLIRKLENAEAHVWSAPLVINKTTGQKFGKSEDGAVWLNENLTSVFRFYQFWLNTDDADVVDYLKIYTLLSREEIEKLAEAVKDNPQGRAAQSALAYEVTKLVHGETRAENARNASTALFGATVFSDLLSEEIDMLALEIPTAVSSDVVHALTSTGVASSNGEANRLIESGAISVNGHKISENVQLSSPSLIKKGKNSFVLVR